MSKFTIVSSPDGDWEAFYVDDECVYQGHRVPRDVIFSHMDICIERREVTEEWMGGRAEFPDDLKDIEFGKNDP